MRIKHYVMLMLFFAASFPVLAQNTECQGTETATADGIPFVEGYTYNFTTDGDVVTATFELLDPQIGLVAFAQTYNPTFVETQMVSVGGQAFSLDFPGFSSGETFSIAVKFAYAGGLSTGEILEYTVGEDCGIVQPDPLELPIDFESANVDYTFNDFGGGVSTVIPNPDQSGINTSATCAEMVKFPGEVFGGSLLELDGPIDFSTNKIFKVKVWSPRVDARLLLKVENASNPGIFFEQEEMSTVANAWEELSFDFNGIDVNQDFSKIVFIWDLGVVGDGTSNFTFYFDDIELVMGDPVVQIDLPIDFEDMNVDYGLTDFGGNASSIVVDPTDPGNTVVQSIRTAGAETFAGTTVGEPLGFANPIPFDFDNTRMSVRVWSPEAGVPVLFKVENAANGAINVETQVLTSVAGEWETLVFDFANATAGSLNLNEDYNLASIFFNFGLAAGPEQTYYWDDVEFIGGGGLTEIALPLTFDETEYTLGIGEFGGAPAVIVPDPEDPSNNVAQTTRLAGTGAFTGNIVPTQRLTTAIPFDANNTQMSMRVWSPAPGIPVLLKVEGNNPADFVETLTSTTASGEWETMVFDFSNPNAGSLNFAVEYNLVVILFNFGVAPVADEVYLWDDVAFGDGSNEVPCENPYPVVTGLSFSNENGGVVLSWNGIAGSIGCQIQAGTSAANAVTITTLGDSPSNYFIPGNLMQNGTTYSWRVRCGCSQTPLIVGPWSAISQFTYLNFKSGDNTETTLRAVPNPSSGQTFVTLNTDSEIDQAIVEVYDMSGRLVEQLYSGNVPAAQELRMEFDGSDLPEGIYLIRFTTNEEVTTEKFMISR